MLILAYVQRHFEKLDLGGLEVKMLHDTSAIGFALFSCCFLMIFMFGEQDCDSRGSFKAKVDIEDDTARGGIFGSSTGTKIMKLHAFKKTFIFLANIEN